MKKIILIFSLLTYFSTNLFASEGPPNYGDSISCDEFLGPDDYSSGDGVSIKFSSTDNINVYVNDNFLSSYPVSNTHCYISDDTPPFDNIISMEFDVTVGNSDYSVLMTDEGDLYYYY